MNHISTDIYINNLDHLLNGLLSIVIDWALHQRLKAALMTIDELDT